LAYLQLESSIIQNYVRRYKEKLSPVIEKLSQRETAIANYTYDMDSPPLQPSAE